MDSVALFASKVINYLSKIPSYYQNWCLALIYLLLIKIYYII